jgi:hypothetical protein
MTESQTVKRKILLRRQASCLMRKEIERLRTELHLIKVRSILERQADKRCLDKLQELLQAVKEG